MAETWLNSPPIRFASRTFFARPWIDVYKRQVFVLYFHCDKISFVFRCIKSRNSYTSYGEILFFQSSNFILYRNALKYVSLYRVLYHKAVRNKYFFVLKTGTAPGFVFCTPGGRCHDSGVSPGVSTSSDSGRNWYPISSQRVRSSSRISAFVLEVLWSSTMAPG